MTDIVTKCPANTAVSTIAQSPLVTCQSFGFDQSQMRNTRTTAKHFVRGGHAIHQAHTWTNRLSPFVIVRRKRRKINGKTIYPDASSRCIKSLFMHAFSAPRASARMLQTVTKTPRWIQSPLTQRVSNPPADSSLIQQLFHIPPSPNITDPSGSIIRKWASVSIRLYHIVVKNENYPTYSTIYQILDKPVVL